MKRIAIIPARGGSKRIPRKNIKDFLGKPIIAYSIQVALASELFDEVMVSTDDLEIAAIAEQFGAKVPFLRSKKNSDDFAGTGETVSEVIAEYGKIGKKFNIACCIYPTAPLIKKEKLTEGYNLLQNSHFDTVFSVVKYSSPIWRSLNIRDSGLVEWNFPEYEAKRSQEIPFAFHDAGQFYWFYPSKLINIEFKNSFGIVRGAIQLDTNEVQDIDDMVDWEIAESKAKFLWKN